MSTAYLLYGKSGSGKGTQAQLLKDYLESQGKTVIYIETGKLFREFSAAHQDFMGDHVRSVIDAGKLMPAFSRCICGHGYSLKITQEQKILSWMVLHVV